MPPDAPENGNEQQPSLTPEQLTSAATVGPQPSFPPANAAASNAPMPTPTAQPSQQPAPRPTAADAVNMHHTMLGKVAAALLGHNLDYQTDPATGKTVAVETPRKPGSLFRDIVVGALLGGAAAKGTNSVLTGFARGGAAGIQNNREQDQQRLVRAQQNFEQQQQADRLQQEKLKNTAQSEMWNKEQILHERDANLRDEEFIENTNTRQDAMQKWALDAGGIAAPIEANGEFRNGKKMQELFTNNPQKFRPPAGYDRIITHTIDKSGLNHDAAGKGWIDGDGNPVNLEDRTTWRVTFVPQKPQPLELTGAQLKKTFPDTLGGMDIPDDQTYRIPWNQVVGMAASEHENVRKADDLELKKRREKRLQDTANKDQARKDQDEQRKQKLADQKLQPKPVKIGDVGVVNGQRMMITKLDAQGRPIAGVPIQ